LNLEDLLTEAETKLVTLDTQYSAKLWWSTVKDRHLPFLLVKELFEHFVPVWTSSIRSCLQTSD